MSTGFGLTQRVNAYQPRVQPWEPGRGYGDAPVWGLRRAGLGVEARRFGGWGGASHDPQGVALGWYALPRWGRNWSRASPPNPRQSFHNLHVSTLTKRLQAR
jgi:hypothetical protein